jgi:hypothetical protein
MTPVALAWLGDNAQSEAVAFWWWAIPLFVGALVFSVCALEEPRWFLGAGFGFALGTIEAALFLWDKVDGPVDAVVAAWLVIISICAGVLGALLGGAAGRLGESATHHSGKSGGGMRWLRPWYLGAAVLAIDLVVAVVVWVVVP